MFENSNPATEHRIVESVESPRTVAIRCDSGDWKDALRSGMSMFQGMNLSIIVSIGHVGVMLTGTADEIIKTAELLETKIQS